MYFRDYRRGKWKCRPLKLPVHDSAPKIQLICFPWFPRLSFLLCWFSFINKYHLWNSIEPTHSRKQKCLFLFLNICAQGKKWTVFLLRVFFFKSIHFILNIFLPNTPLSPLSSYVLFYFTHLIIKISLKMQVSDLKLTHNIWIHILDEVNTLADAK